MAVLHHRAGFVNAHTHLYSGLAPLGLPVPAPRPRSFLEILERIWWRLDRAIDARTLRAAARLYIAESLTYGTTGLVDHHESPGLIEGSLDILADACEELGMRAVLCYGATERNGGREEAQRGLEECRRFILSNRRRLVRGVVGLHATFTVSDDTIAQAGALARALETVLHLHVAEGEADVEAARRLGYDGPIERLLALDALPPGSILAHGVHLTRDAVQRAAERRCWIVQNPRSNRGNGVGYPRALSGCPRVALGTDGYPADMGAELAALREEAAAHGDGEADLDQRLVRGGHLMAQWFPAAWCDAPSDRDSVDTDQHRVVRVTVDGRVVVAGGKLASGDEREIRREAAEAAGMLWDRMR